ncbi:MAG: LysE family transporter [Nitrososphaerales archaeon]
MTLLELILTVVLVTASGALAPGPMFAANVIYGSKHGARSGLSFSVGHTLVEFPLILLLGLGLLSIVKQPYIESSIGVVGGVALIAFGIYQMKVSVSSSQIKHNLGGENLYRSSVFAGVIFTALNPFFIVWWLSVGSRLVLEALLFASLAGIAVLFASHIWMDYAWLTFVAYLAKKGTSIIGAKGYRGLLAVFSLVLIYFGYVFLASAIGFPAILPLSG